MRALSSDAEPVLVAIVNNIPDFSIARDGHWYRIPVASAEKWLKKSWPPRWLAFYQTKVFGPEAWSVRHYARVTDIRKVYRWQIFPEESQKSKRNKRYYQLFLEPLRQLPSPIFSRRWRRIVFIPTTWKKFVNALEINDLYNESPLEDRLWAEFRRLKIQAERQEFVTANRCHYALDFAIYCLNGKLDVETDGDFWHVTPDSARQDNIRDNNLKTEGWRVLRFTSRQVREEMESYCIGTISENISRLGGIEKGRSGGEKITLKPGGGRQLGLFDDI
ncbi:hypothetical protein DENIS_4156 [Desulfonema ishimotonii]|uniref:DUF559 domain-containing protein n=1 Tax=Desulfonema ishimotonii TaxID=45657 RepID=A0A401G1V4_9BACT|nr:DUF559 domain-containing protein [Desulfonema ishimotonii]GBC63163.1 hypothetical protein DENIS_4156 [Desulfonema ishimotonii]